MNFQFENGVPVKQVVRLPEDRVAERLHPGWRPKAKLKRRKICLSSLSSGLWPRFRLL